MLRTGVVAPGVLLARSFLKLCWWREGFRRFHGRSAVGDDASPMTDDGSTSMRLSHACAHTHAGNAEMPHIRHPSSPATPAQGSTMPPWP